MCVCVCVCGGGGGGGGGGEDSVLDSGFNLLLAAFLANKT